MFINESHFKKSFLLVTEKQKMISLTVNRYEKKHVEKRKSIEKFDEKLKL